MSLVLSGSTSGTITLDTAAIAGSNTITFPANTGTVLTSASTITPSDGSVTQAKLASGVAGNGPAFSAYLSSNQSVSNSTNTKVTFDTEEFDTNNNFASNRFTPTVAGYYQINAGIVFASTVTYAQIFIYKNGASYKYAYSQSAASNYSQNISSIVYCNGSTDYIEIYGYITAGTPRFNAGSDNTWVNGSLVRAA